MTQQCLTSMHGWTGQLWRPVILWIVPLGEALLLLIFVIVALVWQVMRVIADFFEGHPLRLFVVYLCLLGTLKVLFQPLVEV